MWALCDRWNMEGETSATYNAHTTSRKSGHGVLGQQSHFVSLLDYTGCGMNIIVLRSTASLDPRQDPHVQLQNKDKIGEAASPFGRHRSPQPQPSEPRPPCRDVRAFDGYTCCTLGTLDAASPVRLRRPPRLGGGCGPRLAAKPVILPLAPPPHGPPLTAQRPAMFRR